MPILEEYLEKLTYLREGALVKIVCKNSIVMFRLDLDDINHTGFLIPNNTVAIFLGRDIFSNYLFLIGKSHYSLSVASSLHHKVRYEILSSFDMLCQS